MPNRLADETSPYLRQHADNPVDWYPWGDEAFERARQTGKPIFLSVGYSACHWCHVMAHESFEDEATAELLNEHFVSVKVDREERPDLDAIYMGAVQALTGRGGWPMSVFLTPDAAPFFGGTYFPNQRRHGMPSFSDVLTHISDLWTEKRGQVMDAADELTKALQNHAVEALRASEGVDDAILESADSSLHRSFDWNHGGWGDAPKFPQPTVIEYVLRRHIETGDGRLLDMVIQTLDAMMNGGIHDQLGGGFHRYSTDEKWLIPHFEKMLYDNAQLASVYLHAWQVTEKAAYRQVAVDTLDYMVREMRDPMGGFYSAQDADSEGEEGSFFVWTPGELEAALGDTSASAEVQTVQRLFGVTDSGNFEGKNILYLSRPLPAVAEELAMTVEDLESRFKDARDRLFAARESRPKPARDDKVLTSWNGLTLAAFAEAARLLGRDDYLAIAEQNAQFVLSQMRMESGRLQRTWQGGHGRLNGYLEDHAFYAFGLLELYQTTFDPRWFDAARQLIDHCTAHFADARGGFFDTSDDHESLLLRPKSLDDGAVPSGGAVACDALLRMAEYTGEQRYAETAVKAISQMHELMSRVPLGSARWLSALDFYLSPAQALAVVGDNPAPLLEVVREEYRPNVIVALGDGVDSAGVALLEGRTAEKGRTTAYLCRQFMCERPVTSAEELRVLMKRIVATRV